MRRRGRKQVGYNELPVDARSVKRWDNAFTRLRGDLISIERTLATLSNNYRTRFLSQVPGNQDAEDVMDALDEAQEDLSKAIISMEWATRSIKKVVR